MKETKKKTVFRGAATALITPMRDDGNIDYIAFGRLIEAQISSGIDALVVLGTTGETSTLSDKEKRDIVCFAVARVSGRVPLIIGTGSNDTERAAEMSKFASNSGADALLVVTPYYNKATDTGLIRHYLKIADSVGCPIIVYNVPSRTGVNIKPSVYRELASHENICAVKEASGNISQVAEISAELGDKLSIYSGADELTLPILSLGGTGVISVLSNIIPRDVHDLCERYFSGDNDGARELQLSMIGLNRAVFSEVNPIPIKAACEILGICSAKVRLPLCEMSAESSLLLREALKKYGLTK